jgi:hypothetical protein
MRSVGVHDRMDTYQGCWRPILVVISIIALMLAGYVPITVAAGIVLGIGGMRSLYFFWLPEHRRHRTFFNGLGLVALTLCGWFFLFGGYVLARNKLETWGSILGW